MTASTFPVVGIGASAGGIDAFQHFFEPLPGSCGMAFVVVLHLPAGHKSMLKDILGRWTAMAVVDVSDGARIEPDHVYVSPPHAIVRFVDGRVRVTMPDEGNDRVFRPIDAFFDSLGAALRERAVGIVLSGTGSDGALGAKVIKQCGGLTMAQGSDGTAPQYEEMPAGAIAIGAVDLVVPVQEMAEHLLRLKAAPPQPADVASEAGGTDAAQLEICAILRSRLGHDFSGYRSQTFLRRVARRMQVVGVDRLEAYVARLKGSPDEAKLLFRDLLIRVTSFFRDQGTFEVLSHVVIPRLFEGKAADGAVRVWVPGCATGEEAYSLAILLREHMDALDAVPKVQVFATDIDESAIGTARLGRYPSTLLEGLTKPRLERFFTYSQGSYGVTKEIRDLCTFSVHNLVRDPPFSTMNLVSCRNLLIYLNRELQSRIAPLFHYSLVPGGILLLGASETVTQDGDLFETVDKNARIFRRRSGPSPDLKLDWREAQPAPAGRTPGGPDPRRPPARNVDLTPHRQDHASGADARPAAKFKDLLGAVTPGPETLAQLQTALMGTCEELQSLAEEHQTAVEELRSTNEELHSVNEELQSANEELETSKEELQSLNEELHTVNLRLTEKIDELDHANSDLRNLFDSTQIATVFLDRHLVIRSFTPAISSVYSLIPSDKGRPLTQIVSQLDYTSLREDVKHVLSTLEPLEQRVVRADRSAHYIMRILPYREPDSTVTGVLVTFIDVTSIVRAEEALVEADVRKDVFLATLSHELRNPLAPIRIAAQLLHSPKLPPEQLRHAQDIISRQVAHLSALLDDLLDVSRITRGSFLLKKEYVDVHVLLDEAVETVRPLIDAKKHTLRVAYPDRPTRLEVDPLRITQVISNLLTNAAKYTPSGGRIDLETRIEGKHFAISVRDTGIGIAPDVMGKVFDMFTRIESDIGRSEGGLGIGLALAKGLVELHGGKLQVRSGGRGEGSEFIVCLPRSLVVDVPAAETAESQGVADRSGKPRRILIADDNRDSATTLAMMLRLSGHEVDVAHSGTEALDLAKRVRPEIAVFDIGMPDLSGYEVADRIRHEAWGEKMTLIAVTGWGQESDKRRARAAGFDHHLTKPIDPAILEPLFERQD